MAPAFSTNLQRVNGMQGKFIKNLVLLMILNLLIKPFWILGIDRTVQNTVGAEEYGFYFAVFNFSFLFNILLDVGITNFNNKSIAQNRQLLTKYLSNILVLKLLLFSLYLLFTFSFAFVIDYSPEQIRLLVFLAVNQFLLSFILYLRSNLGGLHLFRTDAMISVLDRILMILICSLLLWGNIVDEFRIQYFVYAQTAGYGISVIITFLLVVQHARKRWLRLNWNFPFLLAIVRKSFPFAVLVLLMTFYNRIDSVMLERLLGDDGARYSGIYAQAYRLLDAANMIAYLFAVLLLPIFARMIKQKQPLEDLVNLSFTLIITPAIMVAVAAFYYNTELMHSLYPMHAGETPAMFAHRIEESARVFALLMACFMVISTTYVFGTLLTANGSLLKLNIIAFAGMLLNVLLNFVMIPVLFSTGSAVASLFTQTLVAVTQVLIVKRMFRFRINYLLLVRLFAFTAGLFLLGFLSRQLPLPWLHGLVAFGVAGIVLALLIPLIRLKQIFALIRYGGD